MDKIIVSLAGAFALCFTYWFFFMKKEIIVTANDSIDIQVNGGYKPEVIKVHKNKTTELTFFRTDPSSCLEEVMIPDFKIKKFLPLNQKVSIKITPQKPGSYEISCGMNMFHGKIIVQ